MTGIGPVEPVNSPETEASHDVIGADAPRLSDRLSAFWAGLPPRARTSVAASAVTAAVAAVTAAAVLLLPGSTADPEPPPAPAPAPWPANVTTWRYQGLVAPLNSRTPSGRFRFAVTVDHGPAVTLRVTGTAFGGLTAHAVPDPDFTVPGGTSRWITVELSVSDCSDVPRDANLPFFNVTLRNTRAIQHHSFIFGSTFQRDLSALLHRACSTKPAGPVPRPTGSADSQNAD